jgi:hypothetical protein
VVCLTSPGTLTDDATCPIITCGGLTYWAFSYVDNSVAMNLVGYDSNRSVVYQSMKTGARYIYAINLDASAETLTLVGQDDATIVLPWSDLWP